MYKTGRYLLFREHMNLRSSASASGDIVSVIPHGTVINVLETKDNWGKTEYNGISGWCCIGECFAKKICSCENDECCYYASYKALEERCDKMQEIVDKIRSIVK